MVRQLSVVAYVLIAAAWLPGRAATQSPETFPPVTCPDGIPSAAVMQPLIGPGAPEAGWAAASPQAFTSSATANQPPYVTLSSGAEPYPGVALMPAEGRWSLAGYQQVTARVTNTGSQPALAGLRVDGPDTAGLGVSNTESMTLSPGDSGTITVTFDRSYGKPAPTINRARVSRVVVFSKTTGTPVTLRVDGLAAVGFADALPSAPAHWRVSDGHLFGAGSCFQSALVAVGTEGARATIEGPASARLVRLTASSDAGALLRPVTGQWDLRDYLQLIVNLRNPGSVPVTFSMRLESTEGHTEWSAPVELVPGASRVVVLPFAPTRPPTLTAAPTPKYASDATTGIAVRIAGRAERTLIIEDLRVGLPRPAPLPDWLGRRPPVDGDWVQTLDENFDGDALDASRWSDTGNNYWDKVSHFSRHNVVVAGGMARLRFEPKRGHANDDPSAPETDYATGYLSSAGKWAQRYGYFEARLKLPRAPGLWPAIWMMPDRGVGATQRHSTFDGGMEFDFVEHLTRFGPNRYNVALHWDGYEAQHRTAGSDGIYVQPDMDGFIVAGMLWEPDSVVFYANGKEVARWTDPRIGNVPAHLLVTLVSGGWGGNDLSGAALPDELVIDWVRAWRRKTP